VLLTLNLLVAGRSLVRELLITRRVGGERGDEAFQGAFLAMPGCPPRSCRAEEEMLNGAGVRELTPAASTYSSFKRSKKIKEKIKKKKKEEKKGDEGRKKSKKEREKLKREKPKGVSCSWPGCQGLLAAVIPPAASAGSGSLGASIHHLPAPRAPIPLKTKTNTPLARGG